VAALAAFSSVLASGCGGDGPFTSVLVAVRTDGGSPALSAFGGDLETNAIGLPPGTYDMTAVNADGDVFPLPEVAFESGDMMRGTRFSGGPANPELADAVRTIAGFVFEIESGRLGALETMSAGYTTTLFDPEVEPDGDDLQELFDTLETIASQEDAVRSAIGLFEDEMAEVRQPVAYVSKDASPPRGELEDELTALFFAIGNARERERSRVIGLLQNYKGNTARLFEGLPSELRGGAQSYAEWSQFIRDGDLDKQLGKIHKLVESDPAAGLARKTSQQTMAEESAPLLGADVTGSSFGKTPGVPKSADLAARLGGWWAYVQLYYGEGKVNPALTEKDSERIAKTIATEIAKWAPDLPTKTREAVAGQIAGKLISTMNPGTAAAGQTDEEWVEATVQTVADRLLADGESGIDTAVATDDLRQCLIRVLKGGASRQDALASCEASMDAQWIDQALYYAEKSLSGAGMTTSDVLEILSTYSQCLQTKWRSGSTQEQALAECASFLDVSPPPAEPTTTPVAAPTVAPTPAPTPCNADADGDTVTDLNSFVDCFGTPTPATPTPVKTPCGDYDPLCGLGGQ
jgi:hypothetical protein